MKSHRHPGSNLRSHLTAWSSAAALAAGCLVATIAEAQTTTGLEATTAAPTRSPTLPADTQRPTETFTLPPLSDVHHSRHVSGIFEPRVVLNEIDVAPTPLLSREEIDRITSAYRGPQGVTLADIDALRDDLTEAVIAKGYITSGAVIDEGQDLSGHALHLTIVEGRLAQIDVNFCPPQPDGTNGNQKPARSARACKPYLTQNYIVQRVGSTSEGRAIQAQDLQDAFQLLLQDRNVGHVNALLRPGNQPGLAILDVAVSERPRASGEVFVASDRSPAVGDTRVGMAGQYASLLLPGDDASAELSRTEGLTGANVGYTTPLNAHNLDLNLSYQASRAKILSHPLNALDAISSSDYAALGLSYPLIAHPGRSLIISSDVDHLHVLTQLLGTPFSFSPGAVNGVTDYSASRTSLTYVFFSTQRAYSLSAAATRGFGGDSRATGVDRNFTYIDLSGDLQQKLGTSAFTLVAKGGIRVTGDRLYATEMFAIGGMDTVRGYRQNAALGNSGYWASVEVRAPATVLLPAKSKLDSFFPSSLLLGAFVDTGHVQKMVGAGPIQANNLTATGLEVKWQATRHLDLDLYLAKPLDKSGYSGSYRDQGFGFSTRLKY